ncbi:HNH endonuclease [Rosistilla oblonga]|uniref:HNH endonuclease n=1 Tax=Rosistilla oblonga TaxID=2527990 RepID=A0A518J297_9BACT|nr:HNH endonuclease signature motif containing protein [Rosistilla oblonga]QDV59457.1 HNH endonuclease [Rosistilla oblonga]
MKNFLKRIQKSVLHAYDPEREQRIKRLAASLFQGLKTQRQKFNLQQHIAGLDVTKSDVRHASLSTFRHILNNVWKDGIITQKDTETIKWVAQCLDLSPKDSSTIQREFATEQFRIALANAMDDGELSDKEFKHLEHIAGIVGSTAPEIARECFHSEGEGFLRTMFLSATESGDLRNKEWKKLVQTSERFGFSKSELQKMVKHSAKQFVEHVLADAKADGVLSEEERDKIEWLLSTLQLDDDFSLYVRREMDEFELLCNISRGQLPSLSVPQTLEVRSGEIVHANVGANLIITKLLKAGPTREVHRGSITLLDSRAIFRSATKAQQINYRKIITVNGDTRNIQFQLENKPIWSLRLGEENTWFLLMFRMAVALVNQTVTRSGDGAPTRHIPRDVRQRVWQLYGGQCADCGARDYLEFDHIVPVAKGGSNSDKNVQLLCRKCNQKKSDKI